MNCLIIDDEQPSTKELRYFIENHSKIEILEEFENSIQALKFLNEGRETDVVFLDINMPNLDGMEFAKIMNRFVNKPIIVFVTAYKEFIHDAFEVEAFDYILKPYSRERIIKLLIRLEEKISLKDNKLKSIYEKKITLHNGEKILVLKLNEISCIKACERKTEIYYGKSQIFIANTKFSEIEEKINIDRFFKTHRSYIVNLDKIKEIDNWFNNTYLLKIEGMDEKIPVSRSYGRDFKTVMNIK